MTTITIATAANGNTIQIEVDPAEEIRNFMGWDR